MDAYEMLGVIGEGTYGVVFRARQKATGKLVAIKRFKEGCEKTFSSTVAHREVSILRKMNHPNIISLLDAFRYKGKLHLVFEYVDKTILEVLEETGNRGIDQLTVKKYVYQMLKGLEYMHSMGICHRDVKPENLLISLKRKTLKHCDMGFARVLQAVGNSTYVATRWYRPAELLIGDSAYTTAIDVWAVGCLLPELCTGIPLFPGKNDLDQLVCIMQVTGSIPDRFVELFNRNPYFKNLSFPQTKQRATLSEMFSRFPKEWVDFISSCLKNEPSERLTCTQLLNLPYFGPPFDKKSYDLELQQAYKEEELERAVILKAICGRRIPRPLPAPVHSESRTQSMSKDTESATQAQKVPSAAPQEKVVTQIKEAAQIPRAPVAPQKPKRRSLVRVKAVKTISTSPVSTVNYTVFSKPIPLVSKSTDNSLPAPGRTPESSSLCAPAPPAAAPTTQTPKVTPATTPPSKNIQTVESGTTIRLLESESAHSYEHHKAEQSVRKPPELQRVTLPPIHEMFHNQSCFPSVNKQSAIVQPTILPIAITSPRAADKEGVLNSESAERGNNLINIHNRRTSETGEVEERKGCTNLLDELAWDKKLKINKARGIPGKGEISLLPGIIGTALHNGSSRGNPAEQETASTFGNKKSHKKIKHMHFLNSIVPPSRGTPTGSVVTELQGVTGHTFFSESIATGIENPIYKDSHFNTGLDPFAKYGSPTVLMHETDLRSHYFRKKTQ